jgi:hypothetical protein
MLTDGGQIFIIYSSGSRMLKAWWEDPKKGSMHKPVQARTGDRRTKFGKQI